MMPECVTAIALVIRTGPSGGELTKLTTGTLSVVKFWPEPH